MVKTKISIKVDPKAPKYADKAAVIVKVGRSVFRGYVQMGLNFGLPFLKSDSTSVDDERSAIAALEAWHAKHRTR